MHKTCPVLDVPEIFAFAIYTKQSWQQTEPTRRCVILNEKKNTIRRGVFDLHTDHGNVG